MIAAAAAGRSHGSHTESRRRLHLVPPQVPSRAPRRPRLSRNCTHLPDFASHNSRKAGSRRPTIPINSCSGRSSSDHIVGPFDRTARTWEAERTNRLPNSPKPTVPPRCRTDEPGNTLLRHFHAHLLAPEFRQDNYLAKLSDNLRQDRVAESLLGRPSELNGGRRAADSDFACCACKKLAVVWRLDPRSGLGQLGIYGKFRKLGGTLFWGSL